MPSIRVSPVQLPALEDMSGIAPLNDSDADCLVAVRAVLEMHGKLDRFGVALLPASVLAAGPERLLQSQPFQPRPGAPAQPAAPALPVWKLNPPGSHILLSGAQPCGRTAPAAPPDTGHGGHDRDLPGGCRGWQGQPRPGGI